MNNTLLANIEKRTGCLIIVLVSTTIIGIIIGVMGLLVIQTVQQIPPTATPLPCQIDLDVKHDLYDTIEAFELKEYPIGELEIGVYPVVAHTDKLLAVDWRGSIPYPPPMYLLDWIYPKDGVDEISGDCRHVINLIVSTPTPTR